MSELSSKFRWSEGTGYFHWCAGCEEMHPLPTGRGWTFSGSLDSLTATPSFKHFWTEGPDKIERVCHYILTNGVLNYCSDCTHGLANQSLPIAELPPEYRDWCEPAPPP